LIEKILRLLGDGEIHSGAAIGEALGISRAAVWKQLKKLADLGLEMQSVKGSGYRIPGGVELLSADAISARVATAANAIAPAQVIVLDSVDSTNNYLKSKFEGRDGNGIVCLAEQQTAGRGRRGRTWVSPYARNLYFSTIWTFSGGASTLEGLSLAVAVAVRRALAEVVGTSEVKLKWPNDLLLGGRKVGGILLEMLGDPAGICQVVIGVGLNVGMGRGFGPASGSDQISQPWADLREFAPVSRNGLAAALICHLLPLLDTYQARGFRAYRAEWQGADAFADALIQLQTPAGSVIGRSRGVDASGAICLESDGVIRSYFGGEVSLRPCQ